MDNSGYFSSVSSSHKPPKNEIRFIPDTGKMIHYDTSNAKVGGVIRMAITGDDSNIYREKGEEYKINVSLDDVDIAYPVSLLSDVGVINDNQDGQDLVVLHTFGTTSAFYNTFAQRFDDVGATGVFDPNLDGQLLIFSKDGDNFVDDQTGSVWNVLGQAVEGPLAGEKLESIVHGDHFWFSWAAFKPDTIIFQS